MGKERNILNFDREGGTLRTMKHLQICYHWFDPFKTLTTRLFKRGWNVAFGGRSSFSYFMLLGPKFSYY